MMQVIHSFYRRQEQPIALTIGNFDGVHRGHQKIIEKLRHQAVHRGLKSAVMTFSPHPSLFFNPRQNFLITNDKAKLAVLERLGVEQTFLIPFNADFAGISAADFIENLVSELQVRYLLVGDDFRFGRHGQGDFALLQAAANRNLFNLAQVPTQFSDNDRISSSRIRQLIAAAEFDQVSSLLGYRYSFSGLVEHGQKLGRKIGFPTANIALTDQQLLPEGVFAVVVATMQRNYFGVCNIGTKPTVSGVKRSVEVHLFDFSDSLYGECLSVTPLVKIRDELKFDSIEALTQQINQDAEKARQITETYKKALATEHAVTKALL